MRRASSFGRLVGVVVVSVVFLASGCCTLVPAPEKYFDRSTPRDSLRMFQYSVETKQYESAYACLANPIHELVTPTQFKWAMKLNLPPPELDWGDVGLREFVLEAEHVPGLDSGHGGAGPGTYGATLIFLSDLENKPTIEQEFGFLHDPESNEWFLDLRLLKGLTY